MFAGLFAGHKDILGLTIRACAGNLLDSRSRWDRAVYRGRRNIAPIDFSETRDRLIGPIFSLSIPRDF